MSLKILNVWQHYPCQMYLLCTVDLLCLATLFARQNQDIGNVKSPLLIWMLCKKFKRNVVSILQMCSHIHRMFDPNSSTDFFKTVNPHGSPVFIISNAAYHNGNGKKQLLRAVLHMTSFYFNVLSVLKFLSVDRVIPI